MIDRQTIESIDDRLVSFIRLVLALSALTIIYIDPSEPDRLVGITYAALVSYSIYSSLIYFLSVKHHSSLRNFPLHWVDVGWYVVFIALSSGTNSIFFFFFFFVILVASFRSGYKQGLKVTFVSAVFFATVGYLTTTTQIEPNRFLLRAVYLVTIGYLMAYWGGSEITLKRRLALLKDVNRLSNPRFGVDRTVGSIMAQLRDFYDAATCLLITEAPDSGHYFLRRADRRHPERASGVESIGREMAALLLAEPTDRAVIYYKRSGWQLRMSSCMSYNLASGERGKNPLRACAAVADVLDTDSFISLPLYRQETFTGRLYLTSKAKRFTYSDVDFLRQLVEQVTPMLDNIRLVDSLASEASEHERQRLSRDVHDSAIQPYIGLKLGLEAMRRKVGPGDPLARDIEELAEKASVFIKDLRQFVSGLRVTDTANQGNILVSSLQNQANKFGELYHIRVMVNIASDVNVNDRLAAEVFQIVREGLSNISRHTDSTRATINLSSHDGELALDIENDNSKIERHNPFSPRSISERAMSLGGRAAVNITDDGRTIVSVAIPL